MSKLTQVPLVHRWWAQSALGLGGSIVIALFAYWLCWVPSPERSIVIGFCLWVIGMLFQIVHLLRSFHVDRLEVKNVLDVINENDRLLLELQSNFRQIASRSLSGRPNQVFIDYCRRSLRQSIDVSKTAAGGELEVQDHHFDTIETVLKAFEGCNDRTYRCVWVIESGDELFDEYWREYMTSIVELSRRSENQQVKVRILFVVKDPDELGRKSIKTALSFMSSEKGFTHRLMSLGDYISRLKDGKLDTQYVDFGVYARSPAI